MDNRCGAACFVLGFGEAQQAQLPMGLADYGGPGTRPWLLP